jgi:Divergent InlB B-repeat domain
MQLAVSFAPTVCYTLTTAVNPSGSGSVGATPAPNCNGTQYTSGTAVQLTAIPKTGYAFGNWSGAVNGSADPTTVTMGANRSVTANFGSYKLYLPSIMK